jgi:hypothetical protein
MPDEITMVRERVAVVETLVQTLARSTEKLVSAVETLAELVNQQRGQAQVMSRFDSAMIATGAGLAGSIITMLINVLLHHSP